MPKVTLAHAESIAQKGRPWTIRLEVIRSFAANEYWYATGRSVTEAVEVGKGSLGQPPQYELIDWPTMRTQVASLLTDGFVWADTPFIRMSAGSIAKLTGQPQVVPVNVTTRSVKSTPSPAVFAAAAASNTLQALGAPYNLICSLKMIRKGVKVTGYAALDASGGHLCDFDAPNGLSFAQQHNLDVMFT